MYGNQSSALDNDKLNVFVEANSRASFRELVKQFRMTHPTVLKHLKAIGKT